MGKQWKRWHFIFWGGPKSLQMVAAAMKLKDTSPWKKSYGQPRQHIKKQRHYFANKGPSNQSYGFSSSHVWMWELDYKGSWAPKNWCFWTVGLEKILLRVPWTAKRSNQSILKEISPEYSLKGTDAEAETLILQLKLTHLKRHWRSEILKAGAEGDNRGWEGWMASLTWWTQVWASCRSWWWAGKPDMLRSMGS